VIFNSFPRPIESAMESDRLVPSADTCEQCHAREKLIGPRLRVLSKFKDDEANSRTETVLMMMVGGGTGGGIHGAHLGTGTHIRYAAADKKRQTIPWVEYQSAGVKRTYLSTGAKTEGLAIFEMQCVDCHNRAAHSFEMADRAVDSAMASGEIATGLPFAKKAAMELLKAEYSSGEEAEQKIPAGLAQFYLAKYPAIAQGRAGDIQRAGRAVAGIYGRNVFPELKVTWGTYPNNLGHADFPGCFRCHDGDHTTSDKQTITQDCGACHQALAVEETAPEVLKTLGLADMLAGAQKQ
jgi:mono/diheme cytochrome c family protein